MEEERDTIMSLFSKQKVFCQICGKEFLTDFNSYKGIVCGAECCKEREWRKTLAILGKEYRPQKQDENEVV